MNRSMLSRLLVPALAAAALAGATVASAAPNVYLSVDLPVRVAAPAYVYEAAPDRGEWRHDERRYDDRRHGDRRYDRRAERRACAATAWNPNARYWPGQRVWRNGEVYVATGVSASVWNVNSPPEWTPNYWVPAHCSPRDDRHGRNDRRGDWR